MKGDCYKARNIITQDFMLLINTSYISSHNKRVYKHSKPPFRAFERIVFVTCDQYHAFGVCLIAKRAFGFYTVRRDARASILRINQLSFQSDRIHST